MGSAVHPARVRFARSKKLGFPGETFLNFSAQPLAWVSLAAPVLHQIELVKVMSQFAKIYIGKGTPI